MVSVSVGSGYNILAYLFSNLVFSATIVPFLLLTVKSEVYLPLTSKFENINIILDTVELVFWSVICPVVPYIKTPFKKYGSELEETKLFNK
jgi:hypothetical protein